MAAMEALPNDVGTQRDGCDILSRCIDVKAKRPPPYAMEAARAAVCAMDGSVGDAGTYTVALELLASVSRAFVGTPCMSHVVKAITSGCRMHPDNDMLMHNAAYALYVMVLVGEKPVAEAVVAHGAFAIMAKLVGSCEPAIAMCVEIMQRGVGLREACIMRLDELCDGVCADEDTAIVSDIIACHRLAADKAMVQLVLDEEAANNAKILESSLKKKSGLKKKRSAVEHSPTAASTGVTPTPTPTPTTTHMPIPTLMLTPTPTLMLTPTPTPMVERPPTPAAEHPHTPTTQHRRIAHMPVLDPAQPPTPAVADVGMPSSRDTQFIGLETNELTTREARKLEARSHRKYVRGVIFKYGEGDDCTCAQPSCDACAIISSMTRRTKDIYALLEL